MANQGKPVKPVQTMTEVVTGRFIVCDWEVNCKPLGTDLYLRLHCTERKKRLVIRHSQTVRRCSRTPFDLCEKQAKHYTALGRLRFASRRAIPCFETKHSQKRSFFFATSKIFVNILFWPRGVTLV